MSIMRRNSFNCDLEDDPATHKITGDLTDADCWATGVKWHHGAGHSSGRGVYLFWAKTPEQSAKVEALAMEVKDRRKAKKAQRFPSKAAAWRYISDTRPERLIDKGCGSLAVRNSQFGLFVSSYGDPDFTYYFADAAEADDLRKALKI